MFTRLAPARLLVTLNRCPDGTLKVMVQAQRRVVISRFTGEADAYKAEIADVSEGPIPDAPELIQNAVERFKRLRAARDSVRRRLGRTSIKSAIPDGLPTLSPSHGPADQRQSRCLLATLDPVMRPKRVDGLITNVSALSSSPDVELTKRRALDYANQRHHSYATLEHLLLAPDRRRRGLCRHAGLQRRPRRAQGQILLGYLEKGLKSLVTEDAV